MIPSDKRLIRIDGILVDLALSEEITFPGEVTKYPAETGVDFSDHIRDLPPQITLECIVSDTPIGDVANDDSRQPQQTDPVTGEDLLESRLGVSLPDPLPSADVLAKLREMKARRRPVSIETSIGTFDSMACEEIVVHVDPSKSPGVGTQAGALFFTAKFVKFVQTNNRRTRVRVRTAMPTGARNKSTVSNTVPIITRLALWRQGSPPGSPNITAIQRVRIIYNAPKGTDANGIIALGNVTPGHPYIEYETWPDRDPITGSERDRVVADLTRDFVAGKANFADTFGAQIDSAGNLHRDANLPNGVSTERYKIGVSPALKEAATDDALLRSGGDFSF